MILRSTSPEETAKIAEDIAEKISPRARATVIGLSGELGAGKTVFVQAIARVLRVAEQVQSPTFVIEKIYPLVGSRFKKLIHIDAYRIEKESELSVLRWEEIITDSANLILVEWPEKLGTLAKDISYTVSFRPIDEKTRELSVPEFFTPA